MALAGFALRGGTLTHSRYDTRTHSDSLTLTHSHTHPISHNLTHAQPPYPPAGRGGGVALAGLAVRGGSRGHGPPGAPQTLNPRP